jgi:hypothetical protein
VNIDFIHGLLNHHSLHTLKYSGKRKFLYTIHTAHYSEVVRLLCEELYSNDGVIRHECRSGTFYVFNKSHEAESVVAMLRNIEKITADIHYDLSQMLEQFQAICTKETK